MIFMARLPFAFILYLRTVGSNFFYLHMKQMKYLGLALLNFSFAVCFAQKDTVLPAYKRFPDLPPVQLLLGDSTTKYTKADIPKKKPVLFLLFSPDCSHCQRTAEEMTRYKEELKDIHIVMATLHPLWMMNGFVEKYKLNGLPNVVVGKDIYFFMPSFYNIKNLPFQAFYDRKGKMITVFEGSMPLPRIIDVFEQGAVANKQ